MTTRTKVLAVVGVVAAVGVVLYLRRKEQNGRVTFTQFNAADCQCYEVFYDANAKPIRSEKRTKEQCLAADPDLFGDFTNCP